MIKPLVFVYGGLRRGSSANVRLRSAGQGLGQASVAGYLHDLGPYPAARPARCPRERVHGELHRLTRPAAFAAFDRDEGCAPPTGMEPEYRRALTRVTQAGRRRLAWVYWCARPLRGARRVPGGVWRP